MASSKIRNQRSDLPTQRELLYPILKRLRAARGPIRTRDLNDFLEDEFGLTEAARTKKRPSGGCTAFYQRLSFALTELKQLELVEQPLRGQWECTQAGLRISEGTIGQRAAIFRKEKLKS
jgi:restriction endonuclease Mrr